VLEPLAGYLMLAERAAGGDLSMSGAWNFRPAEQSEISVAAVVERAMRAAGREPQWLREIATHPSCPRFESIPTKPAYCSIGNRSSIIDEAITTTMAWYACVLAGGDVAALSREQISAYVRKAGGPQKIAPSIGSDPLSESRSAANLELPWDSPRPSAELMSSRRRFKPILAEEISENPCCSGNRESLDVFAPIYQRRRPLAPDRRLGTDGSLYAMLVERGSILCINAGTSRSLELTGEAVAFHPAAAFVGLFSVSVWTREITTSVIPAALARLSLPNGAALGFAPGSALLGRYLVRHEAIAARLDGERLSARRCAEPWLQLNQNDTTAWWNSRA
jgi:hypothetical protein